MVNDSREEFKFTKSRRLPHFRFRLVLLTNNNPWLLATGYLENSKQGTLKWSRTANTFKILMNFCCTSQHFRYLYPSQQSLPQGSFLSVKRRHHPTTGPTPFVQQHNCRGGARASARSSAIATGPTAQWPPDPDARHQGVTLPRRFAPDRYRSRFKTSHPGGATWARRPHRPGPPRVSGPDPAAAGWPAGFAYAGGGAVVRSADRRRQGP